MYSCMYILCIMAGQYRNLNGRDGHLLTRSSNYPNVLSKIKLKKENRN